MNELFVLLLMWMALLAWPITIPVFIWAYISVMRERRAEFEKMQKEAAEKEVAKKALKERMVAVRAARGKHGKRPGKRPQPELGRLLTGRPSTDPKDQLKPRSLD